MKPRNISPNNCVKISRLRGIKILCEDDLYELAHIVLKIMDATSKLSEGGVTSRPTINGLAKYYCFLCNGKIDSARIVEIIVTHGLDMGDVIEFDSKVNKSVSGPQKLDRTVS
jgi:hypothetical protein